MSGLDDLVAEAMNRKLIPSAPPTSLPLHLNEAETAAPPPARVAAVAPAPRPAIAEERGAEKDIRYGRVNPDVSLAFSVNGVKCVVTIHVEPGAVVTTPSVTPKKAPSGGVKVKGIRGAKSEENEAPEASEPSTFDTEQPISPDNLPDGWVADPVLGATIPDPEPEVVTDKVTDWLCPEHGVQEERTSGITGRTFVVCPKCGRLAPK